MTTERFEQCCRSASPTRTTSLTISSFRCWKAGSSGRPTDHATFAGRKLVSLDAKLYDDSAKTLGQPRALGLEAPNGVLFGTAMELEVAALEEI
jgi:hypothetical protein